MTPDDVEAFMMDEGLLPIADDASAVVRTLGAACEAWRLSTTSELGVSIDDSDWGDKDDQILMLEQDRDELASRAAAAQLTHAAELEQIGDEIQAHLKWHDPLQSKARLFGLAESLIEKGGSV